MVDIDIAYQGELRCLAVHRPSHVSLLSDPPLDNRGRGESFSPTDLVAAALGTCMLTLMAMRAQDHGWSIDGTRVHVAKSMTTSAPRKIARLTATLSVVGGAPLDAAARALLEHAANTCPVKLSLADSIELPVTFEWLP
jgi:putative redox protein